MDSHIEFKRKIDNARNILVGAVPSPAGQIDQITYALIYKFMSDIDDKSARLPGGTRQYFVNEYEKYDWHNLMRLDGQAKLNRYRDALVKMRENQYLPEIFRSIYQNASLPYNDPRTLNLFLKEINGFVHTKSDSIGDAYEHLLSITGAQGDVGQFRTPRHIIKFIVDIVQPGKDDTVLDPACGTAGFLIAAYNYVRMQHDGVGEDGEQNGEQRLTADERKKLHGNYYGFDIDPTMVRTATVNMYLHGFSTPNIEIHDTLTSEEHWQNRYDVILANPPFMTPKGGIQPHGKFGVKANRAEVLFVDYIASHLKPNGRAGIIVPEGIIFQSGTAYKELRKSLVENSLYAVVSLPGGVFNPYAGVKTSILLLDKELAAKKDEILFVKIENDGYSLGAQRRKIAGDQFPEALEVIERFKNGEELQTDFAHAVPRQQIAESGDYNLSGDRHKALVEINSAHTLVQISDVAEVISGQSPEGKYYNERGDGLPFYQGKTEFTDTIIGDPQKWTSQVTKKAEKNDILMSVRAPVGPVNLSKETICIGRGLAAIRTKDDKVADQQYLFSIIKNIPEAFKALSGGSTFESINRKQIESVRIPLPPIEIQREIVAELDGYQKIIDAAQTIVKTYKPTIKIDPEWEIAKLEEIVQIGDGNHSSNYPKASEMIESGIPFIRGVNLVDLSINDLDLKYISLEKHQKLKKGHLRTGDILFTNRGEIGKLAYVDEKFNDSNLNSQIAWLRSQNKILPMYLLNILASPLVQDRLASSKNGATLQQFTVKQIREFQIPLPPIETQREIVAKLEAEQQLINANKKLIEIYQQKIKSKIAEVWRE